MTVANLPATTGTEKVTVPAGKTLTVTGEVTDAQVNAITAATGAKLVLKAVSSSNSTYTTAGTYVASVSGSTVTWTKQA